MPKHIFALTAAEASTLAPEEHDTSVSKLVDKLNNVRNGLIVVRLTPADMLNWLRNAGYIEDRAAPDGKIYPLPTQQGRTIGIQEKQDDSRTSNNWYSSLTPNAQQFIIDSLDGLTDYLAEIKRSQRAEKAAFSLSAQQAAAVNISDEPINIVALVQGINQQIDENAMHKLSNDAIISWLKKKGLITSVVNPNTGREKTVVTDQGSYAGIIIGTAVNIKGESYSTILYPVNIQQFIIKNISEIAQEDIDLFETSIAPLE